MALVTGAVLWRFKKVPEPIIVLAAAPMGLVVHPLLAHA
jgi:chromate transporter